jgi:hypothetical protein
VSGQEYQTLDKSAVLSPRHLFGLPLSLNSVDSKSSEDNLVWVRVPPPAQFNPPANRGYSRRLQLTEEPHLFASIEVAQSFQSLRGIVDTIFYVVPLSVPIGYLATPGELFLANHIRGCALCCYGGQLASYNL